MNTMWQSTIENMKLMLNFIVNLIETYSINFVLLLFVRADACGKIKSGLCPVSPE
jgi:hypothetical protein